MYVEFHWAIQRNYLYRNVLITLEWGGHPLINLFHKKNEFANMMAFLKEKVRKS